MISPNGFDNLQWFVGIVEDADDPTNQGRVRVRAFGIHPSVESELMPMEDLPWAVPINGSYGGVSQIPRVTDWVFGFFADGRDAQHPFLMGTIPGQNLQSMVGSGQPNQSSYTNVSNEAERHYGKPPLRPAQSGENLHETQAVIQESTRREGITVARDGHPDGVREASGWSEPSVVTPSDPAKNTIFSSTHGESYIAMYGEENNEIFVISHDTGTHIQIDQAGDVKIRSLNDLYLGAENNMYEWNGASRNVTVEGKYSINVLGGDCTLEVTGDLNHVVHGDYNLNVAGRAAFSIGLGWEVACARATIETVAEHFNVISAEKIKMYSGDTTSIHSGTQMYIDSDSSMDIKASGYIRSHSDATHHTTSRLKNYISSFSSSVDIRASNIIAGDAPQIYWNSGRASFGTEAIDTPETPVSPEVDLPVDQGVGGEGNQGGVRTVSPFGSSTGGQGNPAGGSSLDDVDGDNDTDTFQSTAEGQFSDLLGVNSNVSSGMTSEKAAAIKALAKKYGMSPEALAGILDIESGLNPAVQGGAGNNYHGIFQLNSKDVTKFTKNIFGEALTPAEYRQLPFEDQLKVYEEYLNVNAGIQPGDNFFTGNAAQDASRLWAIQLAPGNAKKIDYDNPNAVISKTNQANAIEAKDGLVTVASVQEETVRRGGLD